LVTGDKIVVHPIMKWCLEKFAELKKRAYLARFLVKIEIPHEFLSDPQVNDLSSQVKSLISILVKLIHVINDYHYYLSMKI
jgi:intraflagellar transport protein 81